MQKIITGIFFVLTILHFVHATELPTIAVMELQGNNVEKSNLAGLSNRLRSELFKTNKFTVAERQRMNEILVEQGFQQTGCTSSECAVEAGQLLNVQYIIVGSIDKVGNIFSANVRMINVATGKIERDVTDDCKGCSIDNVMLTTIRKVARNLAGLGPGTTDAIEPMEREGAITPLAGTVIIKTKPENVTVFINNKEYGKGETTLKDIPPGKYIILGKLEGLEDKQVSVDIRAGQTETINLNLSKRRNFKFSISGGIGVSFIKTLSLATNFNLGISWKKILLELNLFSVIAPPEHTASDTTYLKCDHFGAGATLYYQLVNLNNILLISPGITLGFWKFLYDNEYIPDSEDERLWQIGGPKVRVQLGYKFVFLFTDYQLLIGNSIDNQINGGILLAF